MSAAFLHEFFQLHIYAVIKTVTFDLCFCRKCHFSLRIVVKQIEFLILLVVETL